MKAGNYRLWKGRKVKVFATSYRYLGIWEYDRAVYVGHCVMFPRRKFFTPRFKQGKKKIHGYSCWWIPLSEVNKVSNLP